MKATVDASSLARILRGLKLDADSPTFMEIENSGIKTVLAPLRPSFNKTAID